MVLFEMLGSTPQPKRSGWAVFDRPRELQAVHRGDGIPAGCCGAVSRSKHGRSRCPVASNAMSIFFSYAPAWVLAAYWVAVVVTVAYIWWKLANRRYLFSPYTIVVFTFAFALLVVAPFQYNDIAWQVLSRPSAGPFFPYLDLSIGVNASGFALIILAMWLFESRTKERRTPPLVPKPPLIAISTVTLALLAGIIIFLLCLVAVRTIPLFGDRTVFNSALSLRPVYNFANYLILFTSSVVIVWSFIARSGRYTLLIIAGLVCMLFTGGRTSFLSAVELILVMWVYGRYRHRAFHGTGVILALLAGVALLGLFLASFRTGGEFDPSNAINVALYGNTFSDVRDGAYIASAWDRLFATETLGGNTYLAGLMSFIPSSVSDFRETWSWGYFTTNSLFGFTDHYGFRGGWSLELFMNFGVPGVIAGAIACGWLLGRLEAMFYTGAVLDRARWYPNAYLWSWLAYGVFTVLIASSATYNLYSLILVIVLLWVMSMLRMGLHKALGVQHRVAFDESRPMWGYADEQRDRTLV